MDTYYDDDECVYNNSYSKYSDITIDGKNADEDEIYLLDKTKSNDRWSSKYEGCKEFLWEVVWWIKQKLKQMIL